MLLELLLACGAPPPPSVTVVPSDVARPDLVVWLTVGLRADPPGEPTGPEQAFLDRFGLTGTRYTAAYAQSAGTWQSLGSLFTGRYASNIPLCGLYMDGVSGVETRLVQPNAAADRAWCADLPPTVPTLPEVLGLYGYQSAFFVAGIPAAERIGRGFGTVTEAPFSATTGTDWSALTTTTAAWWAATPSPRLLVVAVADTAVIARPSILDEMGIHLLREGLIANPQRSDADPARVAEVYTRVAHGTGAGLAGVRAALGAGERLEIVSSTNGASLIENDGFWDMPVPVATASFSLDRTARVPLLVGGTASVRADVVELVDLFPTLAARAGAVPPAGIPGADLSGPPDQNATAWSEFGDTLYYRSGRHALSFRGFLHHGTVLDPQIDERLAEDHPKYFTLFDVVADPWQSKNLVLAEPGVAQQLKRGMIRVRQTAAAPPAGTWDDPERLWEIRMARSHGYW